jgi:hypothetical protein
MTATQGGHREYNSIMDTNRKIPWPRIAVEGLAIIASILFAFSIDAWWGNRQQHNAEQAVIENLLEDLRDKQDLLNDMNRYSQAIVESIETLLRISTGSQENPGNEIIDRLIGDTWWESNETVWESAPMNLLVAGGNLSLITNPKLVQELASLQVAVDRVRNLYLKDQNFHQEIMTPFIISNTNMIQINAAMRHRPGFPDYPGFPDINVGASSSFDHGKLLATLEFQNLLAAKMERQMDILATGHSGVEKHLSAVISMLENELDK